MKEFLIILASVHAGLTLGQLMFGDGEWHAPWLITMMFVCTISIIHAVKK